MKFVAFARDGLHITRIGQPRPLFHPGESVVASCCYQFCVQTQTCSRNFHPAMCITSQHWVHFPSLRPRPSICPDAPLRAKPFLSPHSRFILHSGVLIILSVCCLSHPFVCSGIFQMSLSGVNIVNLSSFLASCTKPAISSRRCTRIIETTSAKAWPYLTRYRCGKMPKNAKRNRDHE